MIVKNEALTLEKCLDLARPHVEEIVVVDTGSSDGTQDIARKYADVYEEIEWPDSFSIARNYSFDLAGGDYILVLDGDEYIEGDDAWRKLRKSLGRRNLAAIQLPVKNLMTSDQILAADRLYQSRVMRNDPRLRYTKRVHNQIDDAIRDYQAATGTSIIRVDAEIVHTGYALNPEQMKKKYAPRLKLLKQEYANPGSSVYRAYYGYQLGVVYYVLHEFEEAAVVFNEIDYTQLNPLNAFYTRLLAAQAGLKLQNAPMSLVHCNEMLTLDRSEPIAYYTTGLALLMARQLGDGLLMLLEAYGINKDPEKEVRFLLNPSQLLKTLSKMCGRVGLNTYQKLFAALDERQAYETDVVSSLISSLKTELVLSEMEGAHA